MTHLLAKMGKVDSIWLNTNFSIGFCYGFGACLSSYPAGRSSYDAAVSDHRPGLSADLRLAAVLFVGLGLGAFGGGDFVLPELIGQLGLLLFIYPIGLQAGPAFFRLFRRRGLQICGLAGLATGLAAGLCWLAWRLLGLEPAVAVGLFCGGTTNTPALAMVTESLRGTPQAALPAVGYSIAYPLAVLIPILLAQLILVLSKADLGAETRRAEQASGGRKPAHAVNLRLDNPAWSGFCVADTPLSRPGIKLSRIQRGEEQVLAGPDTQLHLGDVLHVVGAAEQLRALESEIGAVLANPGAKEHMASVIALGRVGVPDDIGGVVAFLCSEAGRWVNAQRVEASGGMNI